jgi:hypothetical protein
MATLLLNSFLVLIMVFFGAMALYPLFISSIDTELRAEPFGEDRVISVIPVGLKPNHPTQIGPAVANDRPGEHPGQQPAA